MVKYIVLIGAAIQLSGIFFYIKDMFSGRAKPNRITWLLWSVAPLVAAFAAFSEGVRWAALPVFMSGFGPLLVFIASFFISKSYWELGVFDYFCGACSAVALVLWYLTKEPNVAIILAIAGDACAAAPTLVKSWRRPETESPLAYITGLVGVSTAFFAVETFDFPELAFPVYLIILNCLIIFFIYRRKFSVSRAANQNG